MPQTWQVRYFAEWLYLIANDILNEMLPESTKIRLFFHSSASSIAEHCGYHAVLYQGCFRTRDLTAPRIEYWRKSAWLHGVRAPPSTIQLPKNATGLYKLNTSFCFHLTHDPSLDWLAILDTDTIDSEWPCTTQIWPEFECPGMFGVSNLLHVVLLILQPQLLSQLLSQHPSKL